MALPGACNTGGSVIDWIIKTRGVSFRHAVELLKADHPALSAHVEKIVRKRHDHKAAPPVSADAGRSRGPRARWPASYHETLKQSPEALRYLEGRGLTHPEMIDRFKLGFANRTLGYRLPEKNRKAGAEICADVCSGSACCARAATSTSTAPSCFRSSISTATCSACMAARSRRACATARRCICTCRAARGVWNEEALAASKEIILCESIIDALTFWCAGFRNVTASYGVNGFTDDHREAFQKHGIEQVWIAYDRDEAGDAAAERLKEELLAARHRLASRAVSERHGRE